MTYQLLLAYLLSIAPLVEETHLDPQVRIEQFQPYRATVFAHRTCQAILNHQDVKILGQPAARYVDVIIHEMRADLAAWIQQHPDKKPPPFEEIFAWEFHKEFEPSVTKKLGLDYYETIKFFLGVCLKDQLDHLLPTDAQVRQSYQILTDSRREVRTYLDSHPIKRSSVLGDDAKHVLFKLQNGDVIYDNKPTDTFPWMKLASQFGSNVGHPDEETIPHIVAEALIAAEDKNFYTHNGLDVRSLARAATESLSGNMQGGSTLTQQLIKNLYYVPNAEKKKGLHNRELRRKIGENTIVSMLEGGSQDWNKERILETYLNVINFGRGTGVGEASLLLFGKSLHELSIKEIATLVAMPKSPARLVLKKNFKMLKARQAYVLNQMVDMGLTKPEEMDSFVLTQYPFIPEKNNTRTVSRYINFINAAKEEKAFQEAHTHYDVEATLTMHPQYQDVATDALVRGLLRYERLKGRTRPPVDVPTVQGAVVIMDVHTGDVLALQGGSPFVIEDGVVKPLEYDRARKEYRQPGSTIKPFVYLMALDAGLQPETMVPNTDPKIPLIGNPRRTWKVRNYNRNNYGGYSTMQRGLEKSINLQTAWLLRASTLGLSYHSLNDMIDSYYMQYPESLGHPEIALNAVRDLMERFGIYCRSTFFGGVHDCPSGMRASKNVYSLILGGQETTLLRLVTAFSMIANGGYRINPRFTHALILRNMQNAVALERYSRNEINDNASGQLITDQRALFYLKSFLIGVTRRGTASGKHRLGAEKYRGLVAGKTGTNAKETRSGITIGTKDAWFVGFTSRLAIGVWVGYSDGRNLGSGVTGSSVALPIFKNILDKLLDERFQQSIEFPFNAYERHDPILRTSFGGPSFSSQQEADRCIFEGLCRPKHGGVYHYSDQWEPYHYQEKDWAMTEHNLGIGAMRRHAVGCGAMTRCGLETGAIRLNKANGARPHVLSMSFFKWKHQTGIEHICPSLGDCYVFLIYC
jgi:membrane peptidoglycan carboxypeptidase